MRTVTYLLCDMPTPRDAVASNKDFSKTRPNVYRCDRGQDSQDLDDWQDNNDSSVWFVYLVSADIWISTSLKYLNVYFPQIFKYPLHSDI